MRLASKQGEAGMRMSPGGDAQTLLALMHARAEVARLGEREQLFSTLMGGVNSVLWAFDWQAQRMIYVSPAYERIFGRSPALLLADYGEWRNAIYPDDVEYAQKSMLAVLDEGAVETSEYRIIRGDGQLRWLLPRPSGRERAESDHRRHCRGHHREEAARGRAAASGDYRRADPEQQPPALLRVRANRI